MQKVPRTAHNDMASVVSCNG